MSFSKSFPRVVKGSNYPVWEEVFLSDDEEAEVEGKAWDENVGLMKECIEEAKKILLGMGMEEDHEDIVSIAISLFEKRGSHLVYHKEARCKEKFDEVKD